ncbi:hypothetical protein LHYA1_G008105 [Lachnellula hyalina]|uniref:Heterokaryon incompatibility domain-containing protein n=1 Tax=Lachnellula hyalina TaxID=1316788 RepID=A0A8H8TV93_9HELO|nr:uncharacterized protein LHYA1_G008105 [Lachnellula hyalina]TVY23112.1 hypothetical protein LHYA1_G008105 [Lachnellula hyalina]
MPICKQCSQFGKNRYRNLWRLKYFISASDARRLEYFLEGGQSEFDSGHLYEAERVDTALEQDSSPPTIASRYKVLQQASDIIRRKEACELCNLIAHHIEKSRVELDRQIEIILVPFCSTIDKHGKNLETLRLSVFEIREPFDRMIGPVEAHDQEAALERQPRCILELQECSSLVPTIDDNDDDDHHHHHQQTHTPPSQSTDTRFSGRLVSSRINPKLISKWIKLCSTLHGPSYGQPLFPEQAEQVLRSLLVIDSERMCIIDAPVDCRYVALSYCWGTVSMLKHTIQNSAALRKTRALLDSNVPATIKDAIALVQEVGERYLWVDALCIVQDDAAVQKAQLTQMGLIYSRAAFTIVAASGNNANTGLPGIHSDPRIISQRAVKLGDKTLLEVIDGRDYYSGVKKSHWITRAWTLQEQILSKKLLIFTDQQVYWSCWKAVWLEEVVLEDVHAMTFLHNPIRDPTDHGFFSVITGLKVYQMLVNYYRHRQLTFKSDILNAFSGLCQVLAATEKESFHWGLPTSNFDKSLCWWLRGGGKRNHAFCDQVAKSGSVTLPVPFPSWSWAAWHGSSAHSWISWHEHAFDQERQPAIVFYSYDIEGQLKQVSQVSSGPSRVTEVPLKDHQITGPPELLEFHREWKDQPQIFRETLYITPVNTGILHFWTSTATLHILWEQLQDNLWFGKSVDQYSVMIFTTNFPENSFPEYDARLYMDATAHLNLNNVELSEVPEGSIPSWMLEGHRRYNVLAMDFIVISMNYYKGENPSLVALAVEWRDGVAYRIGILFMEQTGWAKLRNRVWKQVALG